MLVGKRCASHAPHQESPWLPRRADADLLFSSVIPTPATKQINFNLFVKAIDKLADRAQGKLGTTKNVIEAIVKNGGPKSSGE